jgi:predicted glycoside hydrolase/deacetylase ChbG (UPF0249 family)/glycosyltransferase involved in cell wall biosynthesis
MLDAATTESERGGIANVAEGDSRTSAFVIVNADDWGRDRETTNRTLDCIRAGSVSSVSAMVFMADSKRAARLAREHGIDAGLHLNFTTAFDAVGCAAGILEQQRKIGRYLRLNRFAWAMFHPGLAEAFRRVVEAQIEEYERLYGASPSRIDGHHHMHLAANVRLQRLIPEGIIVRRNFYFARGEKSVANLAFRRWQDERLARRHCIADYFFDLAPMDRLRLGGIVERSRAQNVEIETHPVRPDEYRFLMNGGVAAVCSNVRVAPGYVLRSADFVTPVMQAGLAQASATPHIAVCICTYKRPVMLKRLLAGLHEQRTGGLFTYSIVVADNDEGRSAESVVLEAQSASAVPIRYCVQPARGIANARNKVVENAEGDFVAMIDDDEFPCADWLLRLITACERFDVDGVLGPVKRHFDAPPPAWLRKSQLHDRWIHPTGMRVAWREARTGNVLVRRSVFGGEGAPFRPEFKSGEDQDFFRRRIGEGHTFIWSSDADAFEVIPPERWTRRYYMKRALFHGAYGALQPTCGAKSILKAIIAIPVYTLALPLALMAGQHRFMRLLVQLCDHAGRLLFKMGINFIREEYLT